MRITDNMRFNTTVNSLFSTQSQYNDLLEKIASQKMVNRASDDPVAATKIIDIRQGKAANEQYRKNMDSCDSWISATESSLSSAYDLLVSAQMIAVGQATATATATTRQIAAQQLQSLIDEMSSLANAKSGNRYLFSGSQTSTQPFSSVLSAATIEQAQEAGGNTFTGTVTSSGTYTGEVNKTYAVKITTDGTLADAKYQFSTDGGRTWNGADLAMAGGPVTFGDGDGVTLTFNDAAGAKPFGENDIFYVNAIAPGYYSGDSENLSVTINRGTNLTYNITGAEAFTSAGSNGVDVFATLYALKAALSSNNVQGISGQLDNLKNAQNQVSLNQSRCGTKANHLEVVKNSLADFDTKLNDLLSVAQDADLADLITRLSMKEIALQASYSMAAKIRETTILNFLK
jgi:flagellar hook-associated protein 3 FlgL